MSQLIIHIEGIGEAQVIGATEKELILKVGGVTDVFYVEPKSEYTKQIFDNYKSNNICYDNVFFNFTEPKEEN